LPDLERGDLREPLAKAHALAEQLGVDDVHRAPGATVSEEATVLFVDVVDSTGLTERLGDVEYRARQRALERALRLVIADNGGSAVPGINLGDGLVALFHDPVQAVAAAFGAVRAASGQLRLHVGVHHGRVLRDANLISGAAVNVAARICATSAPDEVLVSAAMRDLLARAATEPIPFVDRGMHRLKGVSDAHHLFAVLPRA
jgi:class 3 adenylate cyclase